MRPAHISGEILAGRLRQIKTLHTVIWAVMAASIVALPWVAWSGAFSIGFRAYSFSSGRVPRVGCQSRAVSAD